MPITTFTIAGEEVNPLVHSFDIRETTGDVSTLAAELLSSGSPVLHFNVHDEIVVEEDGVKIFAGTITQTLAKGTEGIPNLYESDGSPEISTTITAEDYGRIAERVTVSADVAEGTLLKTFLTTLVTDFFAVLGVTLDGSQVNGPALPAMTFERATGGDVLRALGDATGYVSRIDYDKKLRMWAPGDLAAPFNINEYDDPARWTGDVEVENILGDEFANRVIVVVSPRDEINHVETFVGDGTTYIFPLTYTLTGMRYTVQVNGVDELLTFQGIGFDAAVHWLYYASDNTIRRIVSALFPDPPAVGDVISITFDGTSPALEAVAEDAADIAAHGLYEVLVGPRTDITTQDAAQSLADSILAERLNAGEQIARYQTRYTAPTFRAGQQQGITATARGLSGNYIASDLSVRAETPVTADYAAGGLGLIRTITAKKQNPLLGKYQQTYRDWLKDTTGSKGVTVGTGAQQNIGAAPPNRSNQFNDMGSFGGKETWLFYKDENSVLGGGGGSSITAASFESCFIFGYDCHIAD